MSRYLCPSPQGLLLCRYGAPIALLEPDGFRPLAPLPPGQAAPRCAAMFRGQLHVAFDRTVARLDNGQWFQWSVEGAAAPQELVPVGDALFLLASTRERAARIFRVETPGQVKDVDISPESQRLLSTARIGSGPRADEALVVGGGGVVALREDGVRTLLMHPHRILDAVRAPDGALWLLDSREGVVHWPRAASQGTWVRGSRQVMETKWTDADGDMMSESDTGEIGTFASLDPLVTWMYCADRSLSRMAHGKPQKRWPSPADHGRFIVDLACVKGRLFAISDRGGYHVMEAVEDGGTKYRTVPLP